MRFRSLFEGVDEPAYVVRDEETVELTNEQVDRLSEAAGIEVGRLAPVVDEMMRRQMAQPEGSYHPADGQAVPEPFIPDPAPGLWESLTGTSLPTWAEMRSRFPALPPLKVNTEKLRGQHPTMFEVDEFAAFGAPSTMLAAAAARDVIKASGVSGADLAEAYTAGDAELARIKAQAEATDVGEVDFRHMLKDDAAAWSAKSRLEKVLGRPFLATQLADQLDPHTAASLADRLETLVSQAVAEAELAISRDVAAVVSAKVREIRETRSERAKEVTRERFTGRSRLD